MRRWNSERRTTATAAGLLLAGAAAVLHPGAVVGQEARGEPPEARRSPHADTYHGVEVADPYRWMEDPGDDEVQRWARRNDAFARAFAARYPGRDEIHERIAAAADHQRYLAPVRAGDRYFFVRANATFTRVAILFREGLTGRDVVLVDPDEEHLGGVVDRSIWPDPAGERLAFGVSDPASRWMEVRVRDVATGRELPDRLRGLQARRVSNLSWNPDGTGVWYDGFAPPSGEDPRAARLRGARLAYHELGTEQGEDRIVLRAGPDETIDHRRTDDGRRVVAMVRDGRGVRAVARQGEARLARAWTATAQRLAFTNSPA